jgi:predicted AlkP superfamily phosphohydrolase/phosphomutase/tetratricopeptide (TPR) repeat protein
MQSRKKVLLIGWDAADWKVINPLMDAGKMPNVQRLVENGVMGQIATLHPPLSPMLWTSIATGKRPFKHGIHGFTEPTPDGLNVQPVTNLSRRCKAVWNILNQNDVRSIVIGWWPSHPAEPLDGVTVSDHYHRAYGPLEKGWPLRPGCVHPKELHETLAELRFHPNELVPAMVEHFVPRAREIDQEKDKRLASLMKTLCECVSIHGAATWLLENQPWDFFAVYYDAIDHFCHGFMRYHPPRQEWIQEKDFEMYKDVVTGAYLLHDQMLGTLLDMVDDDVTVILMSDHGFHPDHLRPRSIPEIPAGPAVEHRDFGILAMKGPGIKRDQLLHGPSVLDITPTVLAMYGLAVGADMDGKVLTGAFESPPEVKVIPSWEGVPGRDGRHPPETRLDPVGSQEALDQLVALGYIAKPNADRRQAVADTIAELRYNLGQSYQDAGRHVEALAIFRELHQANPDEQRLAVQRFLSCQALGELDEMKGIVADLDGRRRGLYLEALKRLAEIREVVKQRVAERQAQQQVPAKEEVNEVAEEVAGLLIDEGLEEAEDEEAVLQAPTAEEKRAVEQAKELNERRILNKEEREELVKWRKLRRFQPPVVDYLKAQVAAMDRKPAEALEMLQRVQDTQVARPGLFLQTAELYIKLRRWDDAEQTYVKALSVDPDNPLAHLGMCRTALRRRDFQKAAQSALDSLQRLFHHPMAHFLLGVSLIGLRDYARAADALRAALTLNPNFPQAHLRLAWLLRRRLNDPAGSDEHFRLFYELRNAAKRKTSSADFDVETPSTAAAASDLASAPEVIQEALPELGADVVVVSGLPRSGTSMIMQMLDAGGLPVMKDDRRVADDDNPRGYFEFEPVKHLHEKNDWLTDAAGKAVKIVAPLLPYLPKGVNYRVIFIERNLDEVLASQAQMLKRNGEAIDDKPGRSERLRDQYARSVSKFKTALPKRPGMHVLFLNHADVLSVPRAAAETMNRFLGGNLQVDAMTAAVKPDLHRQRVANS